jgi:hypothetical protein
MRMNFRFVGAHTGMRFGGDSPALIPPPVVGTLHTDGKFDDELNFNDDATWQETHFPYTGIVQPSAPEVRGSLGAEDWTALTTNGWLLFAATSDGQVKVYDYDLTLHNTYTLPAGITGLATDFAFFYVGYDDGSVVKYDLMWEFVEDVVQLANPITGMYWVMDTLWVLDTLGNLHAVDFSGEVPYAYEETSVAGATGILVLEDMALGLKPDGSLRSMYRVNLDYLPACWDMALGGADYSDLAYDPDNNAIWWLTADGEISRSTVTN